MDGKTVHKAADNREEGSQAEKGTLCGSVDGVRWEWNGVFEAPVRHFRMDRRSVSHPLGVENAEPEPGEDEVGDTGWVVMDILLV